MYIDSMTVFAYQNIPWLYCPQNYSGMLCQGPLPTLSLCWALVQKPYSFDPNLSRDAKTGLIKGPSQHYQHAEHLCKSHIDLSSNSPNIISLLSNCAKKKNVFIWPWLTNSPNIISMLSTCAKAIFIWPGLHKGLSQHYQHAEQLCKSHIHLTQTYQGTLRTLSSCWALVQKAIFIWLRLIMGPSQHYQHAEH